MLKPTSIYYIFFFGCNGMNESRVNEGVLAMLGSLDG
jgi:hypothetical protein